MENNLKDELDSIKRRLDGIEKNQEDLKRNQDLLYSDRSILETMQSTQTALREELKLAKTHYEEILRTIKEEISVNAERTQFKIQTEFEKGVQAFKGRRTKTKKNWLMFWKK